MDFFKGTKIKKLVARYAEATASPEEAQLRVELAGFGDQALRHVLEAFQQRRITTAKVQPLLEKLCSESHLPEIVALIGDPYDEVRRVAKEMITRRWSKSASPHLLALLKNADLYSRSNAIELLTQFQDQRIVPELVSLFNGATVDIKKGVLKILTTMGGATGTKLIMSALHDQGWQVRLAAVKSLGAMRAPESVGPLIEKLADRDPHMKSLVLDALNAIGDKRAARPVLELLKDEDLLVRQQATDCLIHIADSEIVPDIMVLMRSEDINVRRCAVEVLKNLQDPHTADELLRAMKDSDWWVREIASSSLTELKGDNNIIKAFIAMTSDPDENIRRCAVEFFNKIIEPTAYDALVSCLSDQDWWVREKAMRALGAMRDERAIAPLTAMVEDRFVGWAVPETLGAIGGGKAGEEIERLLFHPNKRVRAEAIKTVAAIDFKAAVPQLQTCLQDPEEEVRKLTVAALKQLTGTTYSVPAAAGAVDAHGIVAPKIAAGTSVSEAILVLHLCNSSGTAGRGGSSLALPPMHHLTELVTPMMAKQEECRFMKSTGDGFLMTFPTSENAVRFARSVLREAVSHNATADAVNQINLRFAVNFGEVEVDEKGNRLGLAVSIAFRVESVKPEGLIPVADGMDQANMPSVNSILVTESVARELSKEISMNLVGLFELKGITGLHRIHAVA